MSEEMVCRKRRLSSFQIIILGFAGVILLGALLLMLPISATARCVTPFHEALFTATSAVCVTGLVVQDTGSYWSVFGQAVILTLIQIGGLGVVTVAASFALLSGRRISLMQRSTMQDAISAPKVGGIVRLTRFILRGTFLIELIGALAMLPVFCRDYGWHGIWMAVFHSISAFCNAGFDILGTNGNLYPSLTGYVQNPVSNITIIAYDQPMFQYSKGSTRTISDYLQIILAVLIFALLGYVVFRSTRKEKAVEPEPELSVESLLESTKESADTLQDIGFNEKSETRVLIEKFVEENPEAAASLLRNWLNEEWE